MNNKTINNFTLHHKLGDGGMAEVWYAENNIGKKAAVKILKKELSLMTEVVARFENEARVMVQLNHPNIRQVYDFATIDKRPCIIMEYLEGADLSQRLKKGERFTKQQITEWWNQMVEALNYTHAKNVVHRDIKPSNIFIGNNGQLKLLDFGIAKIKDSITITQTGTRMGTLMYMSPEQIKDSKHLDYRTDIYSLAVTFFHLLTGTAPYDNTSSSEFEIQTRIVTEALNLSLLPSDWNSFLGNYLEKEPENRKALVSFNSNAPSAAKTIPSNPDKTEIVTPQKTSTSKNEPVKTKKRPKVFIIVGAILVPIIIIVLLILNNNSTAPDLAQLETNAYNEAKQENTTTAFQQYLSHYPSGLFYQNAIEQIESIKEDSLAIIDKIQFELATESNTIEAYTDYLNQYPSGQFYQEAKNMISNLQEENAQKLDQQEFEEAKRINTIEFYSAYLNKYPNGQYRTEANNKKNELQNKLAEHKVEQPKPEATVSSKNETGTFIDSRDGHKYKWVKIGDQIWMAENLAYLPKVSPPTKSSETEPYYYVYGYEGTNIDAAKSTNNYETYGVLYNWPAAMNSCPSGWHLPTDDEWKKLEIYIGMNKDEANREAWRGTNEGSKLKDVKYWYGNRGGVNSFNFSAIPGGQMWADGYFSPINSNCYLWTSTKSEYDDWSWNRNLSYNTSRIQRDYTTPKTGMSVRCMQNNSLVSKNSSTSNNYQYTNSKPKINEAQTSGIPDLNMEQAKPEKRIIKGYVYFKNGEEVIGASVIVKGTIYGTITSLKGDFAFEIPNKDTYNNITLEAMFYKKKVLGKVYYHKAEATIQYPYSNNIKLKFPDNY